MCSIMAEPCYFLSVRERDSSRHKNFMYFQSFNAEIKYLRATLPDEIFTGDFASWTLYFINICVKNQQMQQLFVQFINYVW
jgi:hypothetical protein